MKNYIYELLPYRHTTGVNNVKGHDVQMCLKYINKVFQKMPWVFVHYYNVEYMKNFQITKIQACTYFEKQLFFFPS